MRKLIVGAFVSLDGVMQAPGGPHEDPTGGFSYGGWVAPLADAVFVAIADHARYDRFPGVSKGEQTRVNWIFEGHVQVPLLGGLMDRVAERSFSKAFSSLLKAIGLSNS